MADGSHTSDTDKIDDLLRRAKVLSGRTGVETTTQKPAGSVIGDTLKSVKDAAESAKVVKATTEEAKGIIELVKQSALAAWNFINRLWPVRAYKWLEEKITTKKDKETGERKVVRPKTRLGMRLATIFMMSAMIPGIVGMPARNTAELGIDGVRMSTTMTTEVVRLNDVKNGADHNEWAVTGARFRNGAEEPTIFQVKTSIANDLWNIANNGRTFYPDDVTSPIAPGADALYEVTYYGNRWRVNDWVQAFPEMLSVRRLSAQETAAFNEAAARQTTVQQQVPAPIVNNGGQTAPAPAAPGR